MEPWAEVHDERIKRQLSKVAGSGIVVINKEENLHLGHLFWSARFTENTLSLVVRCWNTLPWEAEKLVKALLWLGSGTANPTLWLWVINHYEKGRKGEDASVPETSPRGVLHWYLPALEDNFHISLSWGGICLINWGKKVKPPLFAVNEYSNYFSARTLFS